MCEKKNVMTINEGAFMTFCRGIYKNIYLELGIETFMIFRYRPQGLCLEGSLSEREQAEGFPLGLDVKVIY